jgi:hypothetical protein
MSMKKTLAMALSMSAVVAAYARDEVTIPDLTKVADTRAWKVSHATPELAEVDGKKALRLTAEGDSAQKIVGLALVAGSKFTTGTIEVDLHGKNLRGRSFLGVAFNAADERTFEAVYFRPFNFKADPPFKTRAVQYIAWPEHTWEKLRQSTPGMFENAIAPLPDPNGWFHARVDVSAKHVKVYVNHAADPCLSVDRLPTGKTGEEVGLFVDSADGLYANLKITANR